MKTKTSQKEPIRLIRIEAKILSSDKVIKEYDVLCTSDQESIDFLERLHDEKMNAACMDAGLKKWSLSLVIKNSRAWLTAQAAGRADKQKAYYEIEKQIKTTIRVNITHL